MPRGSRDAAVLGHIWDTAGHLPQPSGAKVPLAGRNTPVPSALQGIGLGWNKDLIQAEATLGGTAVPRAAQLGLHRGRLSSSVPWHISAPINEGCGVLPGKSHLRAARSADTDDRAP